MTNGHADSPKKEEKKIEKTSGNKKDDDVAGMFLHGPPSTRSRS